MSSTSYNVGDIHYALMENNCRLRYIAANIVFGSILVLGSVFTQL